MASQSPHHPDGPHDPDAPATAIRLYEPRDRAAVREICRVTAYGGEESALVEPGLFVDLMTRAYTDFAAGHLWVAECEARVVGYVAGGLEARRFHCVQAWRVVPAAVVRSVGHGLLCRRGLWRLLGCLPGFLADGRRAGAARLPDADAYPGHLHVNLLPGFRGRAVGSRLVERCLAEARRRGLPGVRAVVYATNPAGRRFFERLGFRPLARQPAFRTPAADGRREWKIVYGKAL
jgi:ribosomal protein S18 acetylase RimI-like enzyme